jgi:hypothetical protein
MELNFNISVTSTTFKRFVPRRMISVERFDLNIIELPKLTDVSFVEDQTYGL